MKPPPDWTPEKARAGAAKIDAIFEASPTFRGFVQPEEANVTTAYVTPRKKKRDDRSVGRRGARPS